MLLFTLNIQSAFFDCLAVREHVLSKSQFSVKFSILKLKGTELQQATTEVLMEVAGPNAMIREQEHLWGTATEPSICFAARSGSRSDGR